MCCSFLLLTWDSTSLDPHNSPVNSAHPCFANEEIKVRGKLLGYCVLEAPACSSVQLMSKADATHPQHTAI